MTPRTNIRPFILSLISAALALCAPLTALGVDSLPSGAPAVVGGTEGSGLRVRSGPGATNTVITTLRDGDRVDITGDPIESDGTVWYPVKNARAAGWSNGQYLKAAGELTADSGTTVQTQLTGSGSLESGPEARMVQMLNETRVARGMTPLAWNAELAKASLLHGQDMARRGYMEHTNPEGLDPRARALNAGYIVPARTAWLVIETISARPTADAAMEWLLSHQPHAGVLLRPVWREVGAAYVQGGPYGQFWVMNFGCRPNVLPVFASVSKAGLSADLTFTNELCSPSGQGDFMGKAVEMQISTNADFSGSEWEPFAGAKTVSSIGPRLHVRLRDSVGRSTQNELALPGVVTAAGASAIEPVSSAASR